MSKKKPQLISSSQFSDSFVEDPFEKESSSGTDLQKQLNKQKEDIGWTQKLLKGTHWFIAGILLICFLGFLGFLYDYFKFTSESRQRLYDKLEQMEDTLQQQKDDRQDQEIKHLKEQIDNLQLSPDTTQHP